MSQLLRGQKDIAIVLVGRDGCMRRSEIANLLWATSATTKMDPA